MAKEFSAEKFGAILAEEDKTINWLAFRLSQELGLQVDTIRPRRWLNKIAKPDRSMVLLIAKLLDRLPSEFYEDSEVSQ